MPKVPTYDNFQTSVSASPRPTYNAPSLGGAAQIAQREFKVDRVDAGLGMRQAGRDITQWADGQQQRQDAAYNLQLKAEKEAAQQVDEIRVMDAVNRAKEKQYDLTYGQGGYSLQKGINALEREGGQDLANEFTNKFQKNIDDISGTLGNDNQRMLFQKHAIPMRTELYGSAEKHIANEFTRYQGSVYDGTVVNAQRQIAINYTDVSKGGAIEQGVSAIEAATRGAARLEGKSQVEADGKVRKAVSNAHVLALETALEKNDASFADGYLKKFGGQMDVDDVLKIQGKITKDMDLRTADSVASRAVATTLPKMFNGDGDRAFNILIGTESNGQQFGKDGKPLTSSAGAIGIAQVMPKTGPEAAKLAGLPWDEDRYKNDPEYNRAIGKAYFGQQLKALDGNLAHAYAAYNAGPGAMQKALTRSNARPGSDWLTFLPAETQAYVKKNMGEYESGGGKFSTPTLADVHSQIRTALGPDAKPAVLQAALTRGTQQFEDVTKAKKAQEDEGVANAQQALLQNGGKWGDLPAKIRNSVPPGKVDDVMNFGVRISKGNDVTDWGLYYKLSTDGVLLKNTNLMALRDKLSETEFKHLTGAQVKLNEPTADSYTNLQSAHDVLKGYMKQAGVNPNPKATDKSENEKVGMLTSKFQERLTAREKIEGGKLNPTQINEEAAKLFKPAEVNGTFWNTAKPAGLIGGTDPVKVPKVEREKIVAALTRAGRAADDSTIEDMYRRSLQIPTRTK